MSSLKVPEALHTLYVPKDLAAAVQVRGRHGYFRPCRIEIEDWQPFRGKPQITVNIYSRIFIPSPAPMTLTGPAEKVKVLLQMMIDEIDDVMKLKESLALKGDLP